MLQPRKSCELKNPSMQSPGGTAISGEVIVGQGNPIFQGRNAKYMSISACNEVVTLGFCGKGGENREKVSDVRFQAWNFAKPKLPTDP